MGRNSHYPGGNTFMELEKIMKDYGVKSDSGKLRMDLIPPEAMEALAEVLTYGANKYDDRNWEKGIRYSRIYAATLRHLVSWARGQDYDLESNILHLKHALCNLAFLVTYEEREMDDEWDDVTPRRT
jgi:hypothetical protein